MGVDSSRLSLKRTTVSRELALSGGRIDFFIHQGFGWSLVIENKIDSGLANPFESYEKHSKSHGAEVQYFAILSPRGVEAPPSWKSVTYRKYCEALRCALFPPGSTIHSSKWHVFANEFLDHLQTELYPMKLNNTQRTFVEDNLTIIGEITKLSDAYWKNLEDELKAGLGKVVPQHQYQVVKKEWGIECYEPSPSNYRWRLMFQTPANDEGNPERTFRVAFWVQNVSGIQLDRVRKEFYKLDHGFDSKTDFWARDFERRTQALEHVFEIARQLADLCRE
jgi:hypothetical protein